jgi:hypothetical protein
LYAHAYARYRNTLQVRRCASATRCKCVCVHVHDDARIDEKEVLVFEVVSRPRVRRGRSAGGGPLLAVRFQRRCHGPVWTSGMGLRPVSR